MRIAVFTSNQRRHTALIHRLAEIAEQVVAVQECVTLFPGQVADFYRKSAVMQRYFSRVMAAEEEVFGPPGFTPPNATVLSMKMADLNQVPLEVLAPALACDVHIIFGSTFIKGPLCAALVAKRALNIHMGVSPYYRGSSCNFWAMYDGRADLVGATIHLLSAGLDSGAMLFHALPAPRAVDPFVAGMLAVRAAHQGLAQAIAAGTIHSLASVAQDKSRQIRYTRNADFTDEVAAEYLARLPSPAQVEASMGRRHVGDLLRPVVV